MEISELSINPPWIDLIVAFKCARCNFVDFIELQNIEYLKELLSAHRHPNHNPDITDTFDTKYRNK